LRLDRESEKVVRVFALLLMPQPKRLLVSGKISHLCPQKIPQLLLHFKFELANYKAIYFFIRENHVNLRKINNFLTSDYPKEMMPVKVSATLNALIFMKLPLAFILASNTNLFPSREYRTRQINTYLAPPFAAIFSWYLR
jgi:hypothetical protein